MDHRPVDPNERTADSVTIGARSSTNGFVRAVENCRQKTNFVYFDSFQCVNIRGPAIALF